MTSRAVSWPIIYKEPDDTSTGIIKNYEICPLGVVKCKGDEVQQKFTREERDDRGENDKGRVQNNV